ncbi:hypothetical protein Tco_0993614, partial [Tanacetum coccineum]
PIYALENNKQVSISMKLADLSMADSLRHNPRGGIEDAQYTCLLDLMQNVTLSPTSDRWTWMLDGSGDFSVASIRSKIDSIRFLTISSATKWIKSVPIKVNVLAWKVRLDALPTRLNLSRRGRIIGASTVVKPLSVGMIG